MPKDIKLSVENGNLVLSDKGKTNLGNVFNREVSWKIIDPKIESFRIEGKEPGDPFENPPDSNQVKKQDLTVKFLGPTGDWDYSIIWFDSEKEEHIVDPKIAVRPIVAPIVMVVVAVACVTSLLLYRSFSKRKSFF